MPEVLTRFPIHDDLAMVVAGKIDEPNMGLSNEGVPGFQAKDKSGQRGEKWSEESHGATFPLMEQYIWGESKNQEVLRVVHIE
jgi:hypothetical protein